MKSIPKIGLGTWKVQGDECHEIVTLALDAGYEHIDTAAIYDNEIAVGNAIKASRIDRENLWLTSKLWIDDFGAEQARVGLEKSLDNLQVEYLDLYLMHWPHKAVNYVDHFETFEELLKCREEGKIKHVGVSNFSSVLLKDLVDRFPGEVYTNQVEYHVTLDQSHLLDYCQEHSIILTAYSPLAHGHIFKVPELQDIANKHGKTVSQIALKWLVQQDGVVAIPKASSVKHLKENLDVIDDVGGQTDFELDELDLKLLSSVPKTYRYCNPAFLRPERD